MKIAINAQQLSATHSLSQILDVLDSHGVKALDIWPDNLAGGGTPEEHSRYETRDVIASAKLIHSRGFEVACVTLGFWASSLCFARGGGKAFTEALCGAVDAAATFGAKFVNTYSVGIPLSIWGDAVAPAAEYAASKGIVIVIENEAHDESGLPHNVAALCERVAKPSFGTLYDPCNYYHAGVEAFPAAYTTLKSHIKYVHLKGGSNYDAISPEIHKGSAMRDGTRDFIGYVPLPEASFNVEAILRRLKADGYDGYITLEPHVASQYILEFYKQEVPYLQRLLADKFEVNGRPRLITGK